MTTHDYPVIQSTSEDDDPVAELVKDFHMSDPDRTKIWSLKSARERCMLFDRLAAAET